MRARRPKTTLGKLGVLIVFVALATAMVFVLARGPDNPDQSAVRRYFASTAGGSAPRAVTSGIDVSDCEYTVYVHRGDPLLSCTVSFAGVEFMGCFTIAGNGHAAGGWPVSVPVCASVRWDRRLAGIVDEATGEPPLHDG